jgi:hypothetical protein
VTTFCAQSQTPSRAHRPEQQSTALAQPLFPVGMHPHSPSEAQKFEQHCES